MKEKRYSIVRVGTKGKHKVCPMFLENNIEEICIGRHICEQCRYGDTKEQLIKKVAQALVRARIEEDENSKSLSWEQIATRVVEFLGVVE